MTMLSGDSGKLKVGYQTAASLCRWTVTSQQETLGAPTVTLVAIIDKPNSFWVTQRPMVAGLWMGKVWWVWQQVEIDSMEPGTVTARLIGNPTAAHDF